MFSIDRFELATNRFVGTVIVLEGFAILFGKELKLCKFSD